MSARGDSRLVSDVRGTEVRDARGAPIGKIEDVLLDMASGRIDYALVDRGGHGSLLVLPRARLREEGGHYRVDADEAALAAAPELTREELRQIDAERLRAEVDARFPRATQGG